MIIIGFPGIGKSTLAYNNNKFVDLESSYFKPVNNRNDDWVVDYCKLAELLSKNGSIVFVSSHKAVRDYIAKMRTDELVACVFPSERIREQWVKKLEDRYMDSNLDKDYRAFIRTRDHYDDYIRELYSDDSIPYKWVITNINYDLEEEIEKFSDCISHSFLGGCYMNNCEVLDKRITWSGF